MKYIDIDNTDESYINLIEEIENHNAKVDSALIYIITGLIAAQELSKQEYKVFIERVLQKQKFDQISLNLSLSVSSVKTYYTRALRKLNKVAINTECIFIRKKNK